MLYWLNIGSNWISEHKPPGKRSHLSAESTIFENNNILYFIQPFDQSIWQILDNIFLIMAKKSLYTGVVDVAFHVMNSKIVATSSLEEKYY